MNANRSPSSLPGRIVVAIGAFALATAGTLALWDELLHHVPFSLYFAAVAVAAWRAGWMAGIGVAMGGVLTIALREQFPLNLLLPSLVLIGASVVISLLAATRERAVAALRESERHLSAILHNTPAMVYVVDAQNRFEFINHRWEPVFGLTNDQVKGRSIYDFFPREVADSFAANNRKVVEMGASVEAEEVVPQKDGLRTYISVKVPLFDADGRVHAVCGISSDITERKRAEGRNRLLVALDDAVRSLIEADEVTATAARLLGEHLAADRCAYATVEDQETFNLTGDYNAEGVPSMVGRYRFSDFGAEVLRLMREDKPYVVEDIDTHQPPVGDLSYYRRTMIRAVICVPLHKAGRFVAAMAVHQRVPRRWTADEVELVQSVAARCWESIERGRVLRALRQSEGRFRQLADAMPQMVWVTRPDGYHEYYNRRWYEFTGVPEGSTDGEGWNGQFHPDDQPRAWERWRQSLATGEPYEIEYRLRHHSGEYRWTLGRALPVRNERGEIERWFGTCTDIDAIKLLTAEREQLLDSERNARSEAERASRTKDDFLATLSHELRTPLNAILGWAQILSTGTRNPEDLSEGLRTIERNARAQTQIIEDLLDMSRIISGKVRLNVQRLDLAAVVQAGIDTVRPAADAKGVKLHAVLDPVASVFGDPNRLQQVMWNLLSNAVKFTPRGGHVQVVLERVESHVEVRVTDTGQGISQEFLPHVFDRFRQADASTTRQHGGLGLGLSIVKQLVELHGGHIRVNSAGKGEGSTFVITLPLVAVYTEQSPQPEPGAEQPAAAAASIPADLHDDACAQLQGLRVLVVDDEADARAVVQRLLEDCGAVVSTASSAAEAWHLFQSDRPDVLVSDIGMPVEDGYSLIKRVRELGREHGGGVPSLALTAYARPEDRMRAVRAGFHMHVVKPVEPVELVTMVASLAERSGK